MSVLNYLICDSCKDKVFIGWYDSTNKRAWTYVADSDSMQDLDGFLNKHLGHSLIYLHDEHTEYEDSERGNYDHYEASA